MWIICVNKNIFVEHMIKNTETYVFIVEPMFVGQGGVRVLLCTPFASQSILLFNTG